MALTKSGPTSSVHGLTTSTSVAHLPSTRRLVVETALNKLLTSKHFSICTVNSILEVMSLPRKSQAYTALCALHCIDYADMPSD
ncbi:MAG: hypothetical protein ACKO0Z_24995, partial [Betaproteobacteria bacterium]